MKKYTGFCLWVLVNITFLTDHVKAQIDPHFTQNYIYPMAVNPALTGTIDGSYRISSIYRNQWGNITNPYSTIGLSAELATEKNINLGLSAFRQSAGDGGYRYTSANISASYNGIRFGSDGEQEIALGIQAGFIQAKFNAGDLRFGNQWIPGVGYDGSIGTGESLGALSSLIPDISFGVTYFNRGEDKKVAPFGGFSVFHLTQPSYSFLGESKNDKLPMKYSAQAGVKIAINEGMYLVPHILYNQQQKASEVIGSMYAQLYINESTDLMFGGSFRKKDAVAPFIGVFIKGTMIGFSYDVNTGPLMRNVRNSNAFEVSISYSGGRRNGNKSAYFNCPRF